MSSFTLDIEAIGKATDGALVASTVSVSTIMDLLAPDFEGILSVVDDRENSGRTRSFFFMPSVPLLEMVLLALVLALTEGVVEAVDPSFTEAFKEFDAVAGKSVATSEATGCSTLVFGFSVKPSPLASSSECESSLELSLLRVVSSKEAS